MKNRKTFCCFILLVVCLLSGCSLEPVVVEPETIGDYFVFCTLSSTYESQQLILGKSLPEVMPEKISDAQVYVRSQSQTVQLEHVKNGFYRDQEKSLKIEPGETFYLDVFKDDKKIISGETTLPGVFEIYEPAQGDTINYLVTRGGVDTTSLIKVKWTPSENAKFYTVSIVCDSSIVQGSGHNTSKNNIFFPDVYPGFPYEQTVKKKAVVPATLYVMARDSSFVFINSNGRQNYRVDFHDHTREEGHEEYMYYPYMHIQEKVKMSGANGSFNGMAVVTKKIFLNLTIDWESQH